MPNLSFRCKPFSDALGEVLATLDCLLRDAALLRHAETEPVREQSQQTFPASRA
jgi:hypothetical protein